MQIEKYHLGIRILHWVMAFVIIGLVIVGFLMADLLPRNYAHLGDLYYFHKSFGVLVLILVILRIAIRELSKIPDFPAQVSKFEAKIAKLVHYSFYIIMICMPISGYLMSNFAGRGVAFFGFNLPNIVEKNTVGRELMSEIHEIGAYVVIVLLTMHVAGVIKHKIKDKVSLLDRMI